MRCCVSILTIFFNYLILCQRLGSSINLLSETQSSLIDKNREKMFAKFYVDFNKHYLRTHQIEHIMIFGETSNDLRQAHLIYKGYPSSVCTEAEKCFDPAKFSLHSLIVFFLEDLDESKLKKNVEFLSTCRNQCTFVFLLNVNAEYNEISSLFSNIVRQGLGYFVLLKVERDSIRFYNGYFTEKCSIEIRSDFVWTLKGTGIDLRKIDFGPSSTFDMKGCPLTISTLRYTPKMVIEKNKNGTPTITGGRDGLLVLLLAEKLNFRINILDPPKYGNVHSSRKLGIINQVGSGKAELGVGRLRPLLNPNSEVLSSTWHDNDCVTWAVPIIMSGIGNVFWSEYSWHVWALISLVFILSSVIGYAHHSSSTRRKDNRSDTDLMAIILDIFAVNLGNPAIYLTHSTGGRLLLVAYLAYTTVITTGYKTSLNSALTTIKNKPAINDARGIIAANLTVGGSFYYYQILKGQANASDVNRELVNRYIIYNNVSDTINRLKFAHDFALLDRRVDLNYLKAGKDKSKSNFNTLNECVSKYFIVMVVGKKSLLLKPIDQIIERVIESGIQSIWESNETTRENKNTERLYAEYTRKILISFVKFYCTALAFSALVFLLEILVPRFELRKNRRVVRRG